MVFYGVSWWSGENATLSRGKYPSDIRIHTKINRDQYRDKGNTRAWVGQSGMKNRVGLTMEMKIGVGQRGERYVEHTFGFFAICRTRSGVVPTSAGLQLFAQRPAWGVFSPISAGFIALSCYVLQ